MAFSLTFPLIKPQTEVPSSLTSFHPLNGMQMHALWLMKASTCYFMWPAFSQNLSLNFELWYLPVWSVTTTSWHSVIRGSNPHPWCTLALSCGRAGKWNVDVLYLPLAHLSGWDSISSWGAPALVAIAHLGDRTEFLKGKIKSCPLQSPTFRTNLAWSQSRKTFSWKKNLRFLLIPWSIFFTLKFKIFEKGPLYICTCTFIYTYVYTHTYIHT